MKLIGNEGAAERVAMSVGWGTWGWILALIDILVFDRLYLRRGRLNRLGAIQRRSSRPGRSPH